MQEVEKEEKEEEELRKIASSQGAAASVMVVSNRSCLDPRANFFFDFNQFLLGFFQINVETDVVFVLVAERVAVQLFLFRGLFQTEKVIL